ncbi:MAG: response regulator [Anaerolineae bacterium]|nr:response regulator [Anaerolineae bacterium]
MAEEEKARKRGRQPKSQKEEQPQKNFKVLVVDDDQEIGYMFQRLLGGPQTSVTIARDGYEALEMIKAEPYNLIFLDVRLPGMDGVQTLEEIKKLRPDSIVVMMSGYSVEEEIKRAMSLGAQDFIAKPFEDIDEIMTIEEVARYLSLHELTVRRLARDGEIPAFKIGRQWRVKKALLDRWIEREAMRNVQERGAQEREGKE